MTCRNCSHNKGAHGLECSGQTWSGAPCRCLLYMPSILRNRAECSKCHDIIESKSVHDCVQCKCGGIHVDGGREYLKRGCDGAEVIELSEYGE